MSEHAYAQSSDDNARLDDFPSSDHGLHLDMAAELERQAAAAAASEATLDANANDSLNVALDDLAGTNGEHPLGSGSGAQSSSRRKTLQVDSFYTPTPQNRNDSTVPSQRQLVIMREYYARNPFPTQKELEMLAEKTGRPWRKVREYFRQRRNKGRGIGELEALEEPGRATGWLQMTYRTADASSSTSQLGLYSAYKNRFDPYSTQSPLLGGQELIQLAIATFPGCEMARNEGEYVLRGLSKKEGDDQLDDDPSEASQSGGERMDRLAEPVRAGTWLLDTYQPAPADYISPRITQTDLYTAYATRFSFALASDPPGSSSSLPTELALNHLQTSGTGVAETEEPDEAAILAEDPIMPSSNRLLDPVELITLTRMTFSDCEPAVDDDGQFVIRGLARREGVRTRAAGEMFPFAAMSAPDPSDPAHPLTSLLKRKLGELRSAEDDTPGVKRARGGTVELSAEEKELLHGLKRFRHSDLGREVRDICVTQ